MRILPLIIVLLGISLPADANRWAVGWPDTDFSKSKIELSEVFDGGPGKDGIPAIDNPTMKAVSKETALEGAEPVMVVEIAGQAARAYPIRYLMWHEIVNDTVAGTPIAVTFCPLCNSGIVFDRRLNGETLTLGVSGLLRNSDMIMFDRQSETWWQQFNGEALVGDHLGQTLTKIPAWMESWAAFKDRNPEGLVQAKPNFGRNYGANPYRGYDSGSFSLYRGENPPHGINPVARVVVVGDQAWPLARLRAAQTLTESGYHFDWVAGTASALDHSEIARGKDVGSIRVRDSNGKDVVHDVAFAFAFHAFQPDGQWMIGK
ncbi:hypothetical protein GCM10007939_05460 [Amylibacter marinus]|uniref:DUF3179 domain-containing protein n=1 Tax=Amylibacter marinus TaxID=1475483 RepID=A0ABQ5VSR4_9RHOB|nr:DUF3179 domain-containing protein [Amylibacter marinus]GLQ34263.1 hypothetical protein GCM10007939_05460 [Amylibacter marinus]